MAGYRELKVWRAAMRLVVEIYNAITAFPRDERFGLTSQLRRAAVSVPSNIAEGHARNTRSEMIRFASIALGSIAEIETQVLLSEELDFLPKETSESLLSQAGEIARMLQGLIRSNRER